MPLINGTFVDKGVLVGGECHNLPLIQQSFGVVAECDEQCLFILGATHVQCLVVILGAVKADVEIAEICRLGYEAVWPG